jgi:hypothetical protein
MREQPVITYAESQSPITQCKKIAVKSPLQVKKKSAATAPT